MIIVFRHGLYNPPVPEISFNYALKASMIPLKSDTLRAAPPIRPPSILEEKVKLALANGLTPIFCIGEVLEEREANKQNEVVAAQMESVFSLYKHQMLYLHSFQRLHQSWQRLPTE